MTAFLNYFISINWSFLTIGCNFTFRSASNQSTADINSFILDNLLHSDVQVCHNMKENIWLPTLHYNFNLTHLCFFLSTSTNNLPKMKTENSAIISSFSCLSEPVWLLQVICHHIRQSKFLRHNDFHILVRYSMA